MPRVSRMQQAIGQISAAFASQPRLVFKRSDLSRLMIEHAKEWNLPSYVTLKKFVTFLMEQKLLHEYRFQFPHRNEIRYSWGKLSTYQLLVGIKPHSYFTHLSALYIQGLTEQIPKTIYVNFEQPSAGLNPDDAELRQESIDRAFRRPMRLSNNIAQHGGMKIMLLNGRQTRQLGVFDLESVEHGQVRVTDLERTLIDCAVRPDYAGGVFSVAEAYHLAADRISVTRLAAYLNKLRYVYPYHQAIGFYLERCGMYKPDLVEIFQQIPMTHDFYLAHAMSKTTYIKRWRLFVPEGME